MSNMIGPEMKQEKVTVKGQFWYAGDRLYIDYMKEDGEWEVLNLTEFMEDNIPENSSIELEITINSPKERY